MPSMARFEKPAQEGAITWINVMILFVAAFVSIWTVAVAQEPRSPTFAAVSIKPIQTSSSGALRGRAIVCQGIDGTVGRPAFVNAGPGSADPVPQGRCRGANVTLLTLVATAYNVVERDVSGGPGWVGSASFQVDATAENTDGVTAEQLRQMLRTMLTGRFQLKVHVQEKQADGFALTLGGNRSKLNRAVGTEQSLHVELAGQRGQQQVSILGRSSLKEFAAVISSLPFTASTLAGSPLADNTGLDGSYNFNLVFQLIQGPSGAPGLDPPLANGLQEQAGLRLESRKIRAESIVIDRAEMPTEN
jgi:uncharacterized protein (TIGR03435 family)